MKVTVLGSASSIPGAGEDSPCYLIDGEILFDCGYSVLNSLKRFGCDISRIKTVVFSHLHHDHYMGLAQLMFHLIHTHPYPLSELTVYGPAEDTERVVGLCCEFLQLDRFYKEIPRPRVVGLNSGDELKINNLSVKTRRGFHPVAELMYRFTEENGTSVVFGGDGAYSRSNDDFLLDADAVFHDSTLGGATPQDKPEERACGHSALCEAVSACENAGIPYLFPVHMNRENCESSIKKLAPSTKVRLINPVSGGQFIITHGNVTKQ